MSINNVFFNLYGRTNRIEYKRELTPELDIEKGVVAMQVFYEHTLMIVSNS